MDNVIRFPVERTRAYLDSDAVAERAARTLIKASILREYSSMDDLPDVDRTSGYTFKLAALVGVIPHE